VAQFEFFFNRRHTSHWSQTLDVLRSAGFAKTPSKWTLRPGWTAATALRSHL
jgi:hypothetical protein